MKAKLLTVALSLLFVAGSIAQKNTSGYLQEVQEEMPSNKTLLENDYAIPKSLFTDELIESRESNVDEFDTNQQQSSSSSQSGGSWFENFEKGFGGFKVIKGGDPFSFVRINRLGRGIGGCVAIRYHPTEAHNDYLVTPAMNATAKSNLYFWSKNTNPGRLEEFDVLLSTTGTDEADFTVKLAEKVTPGTSYQRYSYDLAQYAGQTVYVAIHIKTTNKWQLFLDDFSFEVLTKHNLKVTRVLPDVIVTGGSKTPSVTVYNLGENEETNWKIKLTDGKGYTQVNNSPGKIGSRKSVTVTFPKWKPTGTSAELTATVTIAGDTDNSNNEMNHKVPIITPTYTKNTIYAFNTQDRTRPNTMTSDIVKIDKKTAKLTTIKKSILTGIYTGDFVGNGDKKQLFAVNTLDKLIYLINGNGDFYYHHKITNLKERVIGFTWDPITKVSYVCTFASPNSKLYKLDENYKASFVGNILTTPRDLVRSIACDANGKMFGITYTDKFLSIDKENNAKSTEIGRTGVSTNYAQKIGFDRESGLLYATFFKDLGSGRLSGGFYTINPATGKAKQIGEDYGDHVILLGTFGDPLPSKDLAVEAITPELVPSGQVARPQVTITNKGKGAQSTWSVKLTDDNGYDKTVKNTGGSLDPLSSKIITFDDWKPADGTSKLTATVILTGDAVADNNSSTKDVKVEKLTYERGDIYAFNQIDISAPQNMSKHIVKVNNKTAEVTSLKASTLNGAYSGDFVGEFGNAKLLAITVNDSKVHIVDGEGNTYKYATITGVPALINCFAWDQKKDKMYASVVHDRKAKLYSLDEGFKGKFVGVISTRVSFYGIAADANGNLYGIGGDNSLHSIDTSTGKSTKIGPLGIKLRFGQNIGYDRTNGILYGTLMRQVGARGGSGGLYTIDVKKGTATLVGKEYKDQISILGTFGKIDETANDFTAFSFAEEANPATIDKEKHTINIYVKAGTDVSKLKATFKLSDGATAKVGTVAQVSGTTVNDFSKPVTYEVTAKDGTTKQKWVVTVEIEKPNNTDFIAFSFTEQSKPATIDKDKHTINISVKAGTDVTKLKATFSLSSGATAKVGTVAQVSGTTANNFAKPVTYEVTAKDGTTKQKWVVTVKGGSTPTSIDESLAEQGIAIYPNPSTGIFNVEVEEPFTVEVIDIKGKVVVESKEINGTIRVEIPHSGIYFINFTNDKTSLTQRIIVSK